MNEYLCLSALNSIQSRCKIWTDRLYRRHAGQIDPAEVWSAFEEIANLSAVIGKEIGVCAACQGTGRRKI
jgi:hypothetical protein